MNEHLLIELHGAPAISAGSGHAEPAGNAIELFERYGVVAREEAYLERRFGDAYRSYKARVRRWL